MSRTRKQKERSPSERLRAVFFALWKKKDEGFADDFDGYYKSKMDKLIIHYSKLKGK